MHRDNILYYLNKILNDEISHAELREFIEICIRISLFILNKKHHSLKKIFADNSIGFDDAAVDSVAPLFIENDSYNLTNIKRSLLSWQKDIAGEADAHFFIFKVITKRTNQTVHQILREIDPLFGKLLKNILYKSAKFGYKKVNYAGKTYLIDSDKVEITGKVITGAEFENIPIKIFGVKNIPDMAEIFNYISNHTNYFPAIPVNGLVIRLKNIYHIADSNEVVKDNFHTDLEIKSSVEKSLTVISGKINEMYIQKGILTRGEADLLITVIKEISVDIMDGGVRYGLESYLLPHFKELSKKEIREKYRNILDYLVRLLKKEIFKEFDNGNFPKS